MKKVLRILGVLILIYIVVFSCNKLISKKLDEEIKDDGKEFFEKDNAITDVEKTVEIINNKTPYDTGGGMYIIRVDFLKGKNEIIYNYKTIEKSKNELTDKQILDYKENWKKNVLETINNNPNNESFVKAKVNFIYKLEDKNGIPILDFKIEFTEYS